MNKSEGRFFVNLLDDGKLRVLLAQSFVALKNRSLEQRVVRGCLSTTPLVELCELHLAATNNRKFNKKKDDNSDLKKNYRKPIDYLLCTFFFFFAYFILRSFSAVRREYAAALGL